MKTAAWGLLGALWLSASAASAGPVRYRLTCTETAPAHVAVRVDFADALRGPRALVIPRAVPMGYGDAPYDRFVENVRAFAPGGGRVDARREDAFGVAAPRFLLGTASAMISAVEYEVDVGRMEREIEQAGDASLARSDFVALLGYSVFGFVEGTEAEPIALQVEAPADWPVLLTLEPRLGDRGSSRAAAADFYALADSQVLMGPGLRVRRSESAVPLFVAFYAEGPTDAVALERLADEALRAMVAYFGAAPFSSYTLFEAYVRAVSPQHGYNTGMEHLSSMTSVQEAAGSLDEPRKRLFYAHHVAHAWIPKRCYGEGYFPFSWEFSPIIDSIWFSEGFAQYAAIDALASRMPPEEGRRYLDQAVERRFRSTLAEASPSIRKLSLVDLSRVASSRYSQDFRLGMNVFSRGGVMAAEMDHAIRSATGGRRRLRDALRGLVAWSAREKRPFRIEDLPGRFREATGVDVSEILRRWMQEPPAAR